MNKMPFAKVGEIVKKSGSLGLVAIIVILGVVLLLLPTGEEKHGSAAESAVQQPAQETVADDTVSDLEARISSALSKLEGAGKVTVVLSLHSDGEIHLASDKELSERSEGGSREQSEETVIVNSGSSVQSAVIVKREYPEYRGALVLSEGADNPAVKLAITQAVMSLTGLGSDRVTVVKMQTN